MDHFTKSMMHDKKNKKHPETQYLRTGKQTDNQ